MKQPAATIPKLKLISLRELAVLTTLTRTTLYRMVKRGDFPPPVQLTKTRIAWVEREVADWIEAHKARSI